jgi:hypothetical protein
MDLRVSRVLTRALISVVAALALVSCKVTPLVTSVGKSVTTLEKFSGIANCGTTAPPEPDPQAWWNAMPAALPSAAGSGGAVTVGPFGAAGSITLFCPAQLGGAGSLVRFGPAAVPTTSATGSLAMLGADPFPTGTSTVYTLPTSFTAGALANATSPTTIAPTGTGRANITTEVNGAVTAALNANAPALSWMLTSNFEGPLPAGLPAPGTVDCKTSYSFELQITHL